ncbi:serine hydroxymethyltransferase [Candidatus Dependentiae bacterium]|nr:serine hydroxymethyltransferase [Candidatus Dependentiae bacterium]
MFTKLKDEKLFAVIAREEQRQEQEINLIASENYASQVVRTATASVMTNKYAEGYPGKRYYSGCTFVDGAENLAIERCKKLFNAEHANVQAHSGSQANMAVYFSVLQPGDTIMGMDLSAGGHLTHGYPINFSGKLFNSVSYAVNPETEQLDFDEIQKLAEQHKPKMIIAGASAYSRIIDFQRFAEIAQNVGALFLADMAHIAGLVAVGLHPNPTPYADFVTSTTHKTLRGPRGGIVLSKEKFAQQLDKAIMPGMQGGPLMHVIAAKAVGFYEALQPEFKTYQQQVIKNAQAMAQAFTDLGYRIVTGGTDNHQFTIDVRSKKITGRTAEVALASAGITLNRNCIPFDPEKPWITSGVRIGTPAITTRGMKEKQAKEIAHLAHEVMINHADETKLKLVKEQVKQLCKLYPIEQNEFVLPFTSDFNQRQDSL